MNKERIKANLKRIGLDALGVFVCGGIAYLLGAQVEILSGLEVFVGVATGIYLWPLVMKLLNKQANELEKK
jgi:hypothetical protein